MLHEQIFCQASIFKLTSSSIFIFRILIVFLGVCYRASLGWFAYEPEWYDMNNMNFTQSEAQSVSVFVHYLSNEQVDTLQSDSKARGRENGSLLVDVVR